jgi:hypothetical protein
MVKQELQLAWKYERACLPLFIEKIGFFDQVRYWLEGWQSIEVKDNQPEKWLPRVLLSLKRAGVECESAEPLDSMQQRVKASALRGLGALPNDVGASPSESIVQPAPIDNGLEGLRSIARFTDQIWPVPASCVRRRAKVSTVRGLGAPQDDVQHGHSLGSRVCLALEMDREGYLLLLDEGPEGTVYCLCPSWFAPNTRLQTGLDYLPQAGSRYNSFTVTGKPGREHLLAIITDEPLGLDWMPVDPKNPARVLSWNDINTLLDRLRGLEANRWMALSTYFDIST